jgi:trehalose 6-phosphate phosphatase
MDPWVLVYEGFKADEEGLREALCTLGNGYMATRGAAAESSADDTHYPGTYPAGVFNRLDTDVEGQTIENESIVNIPNWLVLKLAVDDGPWIDLSQVELLDYRQELDLRRGVLTRSVRLRDDQGRTTRMVERRLVHMGLPHLAALQTSVVAEDWSGRLRVQSAIDASVKNWGIARYRQLSSQHLEVLDLEEVDGETLLARVETVQSHVRIAEVARTRVVKREAPERRLSRDEGVIAHEFEIELGKGEELTVEKVVSVFTSRDWGITEPGRDALLALEHAGDFDELFAGHERAWAHLWARSSLELPDDPEVLQIARLHLFHLFQTASPNVLDMDVSLGPRGLHGEAYRGLAMWDDLYVFPVLDLRLPEVTRDLLKYRHRRLPEARRMARRAGQRGAMYPWQTGSNGEEMAQKIHLNPKSGRWVPDVTDLQRHVGLSVARNVHQYYEATGDAQFMADYGAELLFEIARFFADLSSYDEARGRHEIRGVLGPDEFHTAYPGVETPGLNNNAYTNVMAAWLFGEAARLPELLSERRAAELMDTLGLDDDELARWEELSRRLVVPFHADGVISQFEGYEELEELDWDAYREKYGDIHRLDRILEAEDDTPNRYKLSKQADAVMLFYVFSREELEGLLGRMGYELRPDQVAATIDYYMERTSHGSTLSDAVFAWALAREGREDAYDRFLRTLRSDVDDVQGGTTPEGIHLGAMSAGVDLLQRCFAGLRMQDGVITVDPRWPARLGPIDFDFVYRAHPLRLALSGERVRLSSRSDRAAPVTVRRDGELVELAAGGAVDFS